MSEFLQSYLPNREDLTDEQLSAIYDLLLQQLRGVHDDVDFSPNTPTGDLVVSPMQTGWAGVSVALDRFSSDLDLENVSNNIIFNCDFVEDYLRNFGVYNLPGLGASGVTRLLLTSPAILELDRGTRFQFGNDDVYYLKLAFDGPLTIYPPGSEVEAGTNSAIMTAVGVDSWVIDIPVKGNAANAVTKGTGATIDRVLANVSAASAIVDFHLGNETTSLPYLAKKARETVFAAAPGSRGGISQSVKFLWPETKVVSPIITGDREMLRNPASGPLALPQPAIDVIYRSEADMSLETTVVAVPYDPTSDKFVGALDLPSFPSHIETIFPTQSATSPVERFLVFSQPVDNERLGFTGAQDYRSNLWVMIDPPRDENDVNIVRRVEQDGSTVGLFTVIYHTDPLLPHVSAFMESDANAPLGVSTRVTAGPLMLINSMSIYYRRQSGVTMTLTRAREVISSYINGVGYPAVFTEAPIIEEMGYSGASIVDSIVYDRELRHSPAHYWINEGQSFEAQSWADANRSIIPAGDTYDDALDAVLAEFSIPVPIDETPIIPDLVAGDGQTLRAATSRNIRYFVAPESINFIETSEL